MLFLIIGVIWLTAVVLTIAACRSAARGDMHPLHETAIELELQRLALVRP